MKPEVFWKHRDRSNFFRIITCIGILCYIVPDLVLEPSKFSLGSKHCQRQFRVAFAWLQSWNRPGSREAMDIQARDLDAEIDQDFGNLEANLHDDLGSAMSTMASTCRKCGAETNGPRKCGWCELIHLLMFGEMTFSETLLSLAYLCVAVMLRNVTPSELCLSEQHMCTDQSCAHSPCSLFQTCKQRSPAADCTEIRWPACSFCQDHSDDPRSQSQQHQSQQRHPWTETSTWSELKQTERGRDRDRGVPEDLGQNSANSQQNHMHINRKNMRKNHVDFNQKLAEDHAESKKNQQNPVNILRN